MTANDNKPTCERCGGRLEKPEAGAQFECEDCGAVVAPDTYRDPPTH